MRLLKGIRALPGPGPQRRGRRGPRLLSRLLLGVLVGTALVPALPLASAVARFPLVLQHATGPVGVTSLMQIRAREAASEGRQWTPRHRWLSLEEISPHIVQAVLAGE